MDHLVLEHWLAPVGYWSSWNVDTLTHTYDLPLGVACFLCFISDGRSTRDLKWVTQSPQLPGLRIKSPGFTRCPLREVLANGSPVFVVAGSAFFHRNGIGKLQYSVWICDTPMIYTVGSIELKHRPEFVPPQREHLSARLYGLTGSKTAVSH